METIMMMWQAHEQGWRLMLAGALEQNEMVQTQTKAFGLKRALVIAGYKTNDEMRALEHLIEAHCALVSVGLQHIKDLNAYLRVHFNYKGA